MGEITNLKKVLLSSVLVVMYFFGLPAQAKYGGGTGEPNDPYLIYNADQMNAIGADSNDWDKHFLLCADIDLSGYTGTSFNIIGSYSNRIPFTGVFDGDNHRISNFNYESNDIDYVGLFRCIQGTSAEIKNLGLINSNIDAGTGSRVGSLVGRLYEGTISGCYVNGGSVSGNNYVGGLVGTKGIKVFPPPPIPPPLTHVINCYAIVDVTGDGDYIGGLIGDQYKGTISNCFAAGNTFSSGNAVGGLVGLHTMGSIYNSYATGTILGTHKVGGLVGENFSGVTNCYSTGSVEGENAVGGLVGSKTSGTISYCYATGSVVGANDVGGLIGTNEYGTVMSSFWDIEASGLNNMCGGQGPDGSGCDNANGKTTGQMQTESTFTDAGWDFITRIWKMCDGPSYPSLWWEICPVRPVYYVDADANGANDGSSWANAYNHLQDALAAAYVNDEIRVAQGTYKPDSNSADPNGTGNRRATFRLVNGVIIKGGYAGFGQPDPNARDIQAYETILSGDLNGDDVEVQDPLDLLIEPTRKDNSWTVVIGSGTDETTVLDGLTITKGSNSSGGGGMYNKNGSPTLIRCTFRANSAYWDMCSGGGMLNLDNSNPTLINCSFIGNAAYPGGGMANYTSSPTLINCAFIGNKSGGPEWGAAGVMENWKKSSPTLINCLLIGNSADYDGGVMRSGGDYQQTGSNPTLINCTIVGNSAGNRGGAILQGTGTLTLTNCIMWNNTAPRGDMMYLRQGYQVDAIVIISYSDIQAGQSGFYIEPGCTLNWGEGNIDADPRFALPGYWGNVNNPNIIVEPDDPNAMWFDGDYHLKSRAGRWDPNSENWIQDALTSPCIDAGNPNSDWTSELWPHGKCINMGAYGGTPEASMSGNIADFNIDGVVDDRDMKLLIDNWLYEDLLLPEDLSRDGIVNFTDFSIFARILGFPGPASNPNPPNGAATVNITADLSWTAGRGATSHDVYFGTSNPPPFIRNQTDTTFDPGTMDYITMYYWRIDEVNKWGTTAGTVWSFTTIMSPPSTPLP